MHRTLLIFMFFRRVCLSLTYCMPVFGSLFTALGFRVRFGFPFGFFSCAIYFLLEVNELI